MSGAPDSSDHPKIGARTVRLGQVWEAASKLAAAQVPKQLSGSTRRATISVGLTTSLGYGSPSSLHDRFVHPDAPPPSHLRSRSKLGIICCLVSVILAIAISLVIVFGEFPLGDIWHQPANNHSWTRLNWATSAMRGEQATPRLIVQSSRGVVGEPVPLGLAIQGPVENVVVIITGMLAGMEVSTGFEVGVHKWELLPEDVGYAFVVPPENFVGSAGLVAELRLADDKIVDRQAIYLEWAPPSSPGLAENQHNREEAAETNPPVLAREPNLEKAVAASSTSLAPKTLDQPEVTVSSRPQVLASEPDLEKAVAASSTSLAPKTLDQPEVTVSSSPPVLASEPDLAKAAAASSTSLAPKTLDQPEVTASSSPPVLASERDLEKAAAASSTSLAPKTLDQPEVTVSSSPPVLASEPDLEKAAAPSSTSLAPKTLDQPEVTVSSSPPVLASEPDLEKAAAPSSTSLAPKTLDQPEVTASSSPPVLASERDLAKALAAIPSSSSLAPEPPDRQEGAVSAGPPIASDRELQKLATAPSSPSFEQSHADHKVSTALPRIAQKQVDREEAAAGVRTPIFAPRQVDQETIAVLLKRGKELLANGDVSAARITLKRAADANVAEAALALASTYDPFVLRELKVYGFPADAETARAWYEKAKALGSAVAPRRLEILARGAR